MAAPIILIEVQPRRVADGVAETVRLAGGGAVEPYYLEGKHWRAGVAGLPTIVTSLDFAGDDLGTGGVPQALELRWAPASQADLALQAAYYWTDAPISVRIGPEGALPPVVLPGRVLDAAVDNGQLVISLADPAADLKRPVLVDRFQGTGGLEGPAEWEGLIRRRAWGQVFNIKGDPIDKANNVYCFGDPARAWQSFDSVRDKGAAAAQLGLVDWQGSADATFAALQAADAADGGGVAAPSIACVKWWTEPAGDLCADVHGEIAGGYVETAAEIAERIVGARSTLLFAAGSVAAAAAARPGAAGWFVDDENTTVSEALDDLLGGVSLAWVLDSDGAIVLREWSWGASVAPVRSIQSSRRQTFKPVGTRRIGYRRNHNKMARGDIAGIVLVSDIAGLGAGATADDLAELDPGAADKLSTIEPGATVGATVGSGDQPGNLQKPGGGTYTDGDIETSKGTSADTANVGGRPVGQVLGDIDTAKSDIQDLIATYGDTAAAADSAAAAAGYASTAQTASNNAAAAKADAEAARDAADNSASSASDSATLSASKAGDAAGSAAAAAESLNAVTAIQTDVTQKASTVTEQTNTATTKAGEASASAAQAATSASDAQGYANTASTQSSNAANSATLAGQKADAASGSASTATTKASDAAQSASAAQASQVSAQTAAASLFPADFRENGTYWTRAQDGLNPAPIAAGGANTFLNDPVYGTIYQGSGSGTRFGTRLAPIAYFKPIAGRRYRVEALVKIVDAGTSTTTVTVRPLWRIDTQSGGFVVDIVGAPTISAAPVGAWSVVSSEVDGSSLLSAGPVVRPYVQVEGTVGGLNSTFDGIWQCAYLKFSDITESSSAASSASAAATSASQAAASNTAADQHAAAASASATTANTASGNAQTYAGQASQSATNAANSESSAAVSSGSAAAYANAAFDAAVETMPGDFVQDGTFWFNGFQGDPATRAALVATSVFAFTNTSQGRSLGINAPASAPYVDVGHIAVRKLIPGRKYRLSARGGMWGMEPAGAPKIELYAVGLDVSYSYVGPATKLVNKVLPDRAWYDLTLDVDADTAIAAGAAYLRLLLRANNGNVANAMVWAFGRLDDITESVSAASSASTAQSQASAATSQAAAAQSSATVAATVAGASLNGNPVFAQWTGSWPEPWGAPAISSGASITRVAGVNSPYALRGVAVAGGQCYISQTYPAGTGLASMGPGYYVVEVDVHIDAGDLSGAGVLLDGIDASNGNPQRLPVPLTGMLGSAGAAGKTYYLRQLVQLTSATIVKGRIYLMTSWTGFGTVTAKTLTWYRCAVRPATDQEIAAKQASADISSLTASVSQQAGAIADLQDKTATAYVETTASVPGAEATVQIVATTSDGSPASAINIAADAVTIGGQRTLEVVGGEVTVNGNLSATSGIALGTTGNIWPVALRPKDYLVSDGDVVSFGVDLGSIPQVDFSLLNLDPLNAGESYHLYADGLSSTGFTARLRIVVPGTPSNYDLTVDASGASGEPNRVISKGSNPDSSDGSYQITFTGQVWASSRIVKPQPLVVQQTSTTATYSVWVKKNNAWSKIATHTESSVSPDAADGGGTNFNNFTYTNSYQLGSGVQAIGVSLDTYTNSLGNGTYGAASLTDITHFKWTARGTSTSERTATSHGQTSRVTVRPQ